MSEKDLLFVASGKLGVRVYNISDWQQPSLVGLFGTPGYARGVDLDWPYLYVADDSEGLEIWNLTASFFPSEAVAQLKGLWSAYDVRVRNGTAYIAARNNGLRIVNVENVAFPIELSPYMGSVTSRSLCWHGNYLLVAEGDQGLGIYAITTDKGLNLVKQQPGSGWNRIDWVAIDGEEVHLREESGSTIRFPTSYILSDELNTKFTSYSTIAVPAAYFFKEKLVVHNNNHLLFKRKKTEWKSLAVGSFSPAACHSFAVDAQGEIAYLSCRNGGLYLVNTTEPDHPMQLNHWSGHVKDLVVIESIAYVLTGDLYTLNISIPSAISTLDAISFSSGAERLHVQESIAYVSLNGGNLQLVNVSDPTNLQALGSTKVGEMIGMGVAGSFLYGLTPDGFLTTLNIDDPWVPTKFGSLNVGIRAGDDIYSANTLLAIKGGFVYVDGYTFVRIVAIADPWNLKEINSIWFPNVIMSLKIAGDYLYVGSGGTVYIFDLGEPTDPLLVTKLKSTANFIYDMKISNGLLMLAISTSGLRIIDANSFNAPSLALTIEQASVDDYTLSFSINPTTLAVYQNDPFELTGLVTLPHRQCDSYSIDFEALSLILDHFSPKWLPNIVNGNDCTIKNVADNQAQLIMQLGDNQLIGFELQNHSWQRSMNLRKKG